MGFLSPPIRLRSVPAVIVTDQVARWGPVSILTAPPLRVPKILVEDCTGITPASFRRAEPRC